MMEDYFNTTCEWKHIIGTDGYNQAEYEITNPPCRIRDSSKLIRDKNGAQVMSTSQVFIKDPVQLDDLINGRTVIAVKDIDLLDYLDGYEVYLA